MAHMIDITNGRAAMAYVGQKPWHGLGQELTPGASIQEWTEQAGLAYTVNESPVLFRNAHASEPEPFKGRKVLHRSDNGTPLAVVSDGYHVVQPGEVMHFFERLAEAGGYELETAGALSHGRRVWALAKVAKGVEVLTGDIVDPYLLLATSYDGTMATTAKFTAIRAVCNNTVTAALGAAGSAVKVLHSERFDADRVRQDLGIVTSEWDRFLIQSRKLAGEPMKTEEADAFVQALLAPYHTAAKDVTQSKAYRRIMDLFNGRAIGSDIPGVAGTRWAALNAVTEMVDHERGRSANTRLESAWFGTGAALKSKALELLSA